MEYQIIPISSENSKDLTFLYKAVFGNAVTLDFVEKKLDTNYLGKSYFGHLAYYQGKPVAFHGAIPVLMRYQDNYEIAAQYGDAMTLPSHTGKGLFTKLGKLTDKQLIKDGIRFVWGFPNQNSEYGYLNKLEWKYQERIQGFKIKTAKLPLEKIVKKTGITNTLYTQHIQKVFEKYQTDKSLAGSVFQNMEVVSTARNKEYYKYKAFANNFAIELNNVLFWIKIKNGLLIGDMETSSEDDFDNALGQLKAIASKHGIGEIIFQASPGTQIVKYLSKRGYTSFESWIVGYKNFNSLFPLEKLKLTFGDLDTF